MKNIKYIIFTTLIFSSIAVFSQNSASDTVKNFELHVITKLDGNEYIGVIISDDGREVLIETSNLGKIYIPKSEIRSIVKAKGDKDIVNGEYRSSGPFTTRYAFTTNAHPIKKGENYAMLNIYGPEIHFAVMDNLSIGVMSTWIASPMVLALKYTIKTPNPKINLALGTLLATSGYLYNFRGYGGLHWGTITFGDRMNNISLSGGYAYLQSGDEKTYNIDGVYNNILPATEFRKQPTFPAVMFSLAGIFKVGAKASFVFDSMGFIVTEQLTDTEYVEHTPGYWDEINSVQVNPTYTITVSTNVYKSLGLLLMPGFRFQKTPNRAFQISLSGISLIGHSNTSIPFPMCSWYFRF